MGRGSWELTGRQAAVWWWCWLDMDDVNVIRGFIQNTRVTVWIRSKSELGFLISAKGRFFEVVTHAGQVHGKLTVKGASLVYSAAVTLPHLMWHQQRQTSHWIARWLCATLLRQTERKLLLKLGAGPGLGEMSPQKRRRISRNPATELG